MPHTTPVDPGPFMQPPVALAGKRFQGKIGNAKVTIKFAQGTFSASGQLRGQGVWQSQANRVGMQSPTSIFMVTVNGGEMSGERVFNNGAREPVSLSLINDAPSLYGTSWSRSTVSGAGVPQKQVYYFSRNGVTNISGDNTFTGSWVVDDDNPEYVKMTFGGFVEIGSFDDNGTTMSILGGSSPHGGRWEEKLHKE